MADNSRVSLAALTLLCGEVAVDDVLHAATFWVSKGVLIRSGGSSGGEAGDHSGEVFFSVEENQAAHLAGSQDESADSDADADQVDGIAEVTG